MEAINVIKICCLGFCLRKFWFLCHCKPKTICRKRQIYFWRTTEGPFSNCIGDFTLLLRKLFWFYIITIARECRYLKYHSWNKLLRTKHIFLFSIRTHQEQWRETTNEGFLKSRCIDIVIKGTKVIAVIERM